MKMPEQDDPYMDKYHWKLVMLVQEKVCDIEFEEDSEDDELVVESAVLCTVKAVEMNEDSEIPKKTYVNFKYAGSKEIFTRCMKHMMDGLRMFQLEGNFVRGVI
jgi:hypothetical protein